MTEFPLLMDSGSQLVVYLLVLGQKTGQSSHLAHKRGLLIDYVSLHQYGGLLGDMNNKKLIRNKAQSDPNVLSLKRSLFYMPVQDCQWSNPTAKAFITAYKSVKMQHSSFSGVAWIAIHTA